MSYTNSSFSSSSNANNQEFMQAMEADIINADIPEAERERLLKNFLVFKEKQVNILLLGATGAGKTSTINALFGAERAKVGVGVDPETMEIEKYELGNLFIYDTPGLGDGREADNRHGKKVANMLRKTDADGRPVIDLAMVVFDGGSRDLGTPCETINKIVIPNLGDHPEKRILVAINQADMAMKGRYWNHEKNCPEPELEKFLNEKVESVKRRVKESTGVDVEPIFYSAGYKDGDRLQNRPYNLTKLLYYIIRNTPKEKRLAYVDNINRDEIMWKDNDNLKDYRKGIFESIAESVSDCASTGAELGEAVGSVFGGKGRAAGRALGSIVGGAVGLVKGVFGSLFG